MGKKVIGYGNFFCWSCGSRIEKGPTCPHCGVTYGGEKKYQGISLKGAGGLGYSKEANHPTLKKYANNYKKISLIWLIGLTLIVPLGLVLSGQVDLDGEGKFVLPIVVGVFWIFGLPFVIGKRNKPDWEGVVETKDIINMSNGGRSFIINFRKNNGKLIQFKESSTPTIFNYLQEGERVYYHGKKYLGYFEKYNKTRDSFIPCSGCKNQCDPRNNFCERCGCILLKGEI